MEKSQFVRVLDVVAIGPLIIAAGRRSTVSPNMRALLMVTGVATILYNGANFLANEKATRL